MVRTPGIGAQAKNGKSGHQAQLKPHPAATASARTAAARPDSGLLKLQRLAGNQVVAQLLSVQRLKKDVTPKLLVHIFHGEKGAGGEITGYHSENEKDAEKTIAAVSKAAKRSPADPVGVYTAAPVVAKASVAKPGKSGKGGKDGGKGLKDKTSGSSFFPAAWDRATVTKVIAESTEELKEFKVQPGRGLRGPRCADEARRRHPVPRLHADGGRGRRLGQQKEKRRQEEEGEMSCGLVTVGTPVYTITGQC